MTGWGHFNSHSGGDANEEPAEILDSFVPGDLDEPFSLARPDTTIVLTDRSHPITQGLPASFSYGAGCCLEYNRHPLQPGDVSLGIPFSGSSGPGNALIYRENIGAGKGRSVYLGAIQVTGYCAIEGLCWSFADRDGIDDPAKLTSWPSAFGASHDPSRPQMINELLLQNAPGLDEEASIDRFVGNMHILILRILPF